MWSPWHIFLKINPIHSFTITDNFPKIRVHVYRSTNVGAIQATTYYDTNLTKSPFQKSDPLDRFFWKSIPSMPLLLLKCFSENLSHPCLYNYWNVPKVLCKSINKCRRYPGDNILWQIFNQVPLPKLIPWQIVLKINPILAFTITDNLLKVRVDRSNVGNIQATTCYDTRTDRRVKTIISTVCGYTYADRSVHFSSRDKQ
jgi:hypothetical protein